MLNCTCISILMRVIRWKGRSIKDVKGRRLQSGDTSSRLITTEKSLLLSLPVHTHKHKQLFNTTFIYHLTCMFWSLYSKSKYTLGI